MDESLRGMYATHTRQQIADELGLTAGQVRSRFCTLGMASKIRQWSDAEVNRLMSAYQDVSLNREIELDALALELGRCKTNISRKARSLGLTDICRKRVLVLASAPKFANIEDRRVAQSETAKRRIQENGHPRGALGMKHTAAAKEMIATKNRERWASLTKEQQDDHVLKTVKARRAHGIPFSKARGNWKAGWREVGTQRCYFRSRWEANYARYLEWLCSIGQIMKWEHEPHTFWFEGIKRGCVSYLPDFRVTELGGSIQWHEVKGWMDARSKTTISRMAIYHPNEILIVIQEKQYKEIKRKVSKMIPEWES